MNRELKTKPVEVNKVYPFSVNYKRFTVCEVKLDLK